MVGQQRRFFIVLLDPANLIQVTGSANKVWTFCILPYIFFITSCVAGVKTSAVDAKNAAAKYCSILFELLDVELYKKNNCLNCITFFF